MKARIEKKLSKRLVEIAPSLFRGAWVYSCEPSMLAEKQGSRVSNVLCVGGGVDYWGEGEDDYTVWRAWTGYGQWSWCGHFEPYPEGHERQGHPNTEGFKPTTRNLLKLAAQCEANPI